MKQIVAVLAVFGAVAFFAAADADAQCYRSGFNTGFYGGTTVYRPAGNFYYQSRPVYNYRVPNYYNQRVYYGGNFNRYPGHIHRYGYPAPYYRGGSGFYYQGGNVGVRVRF